MKTALAAFLIICLSAAGFIGSVQATESGVPFSDSMIRISSADAFVDTALPPSVSIIWVSNNTTTSTLHRAGICKVKIAVTNAYASILPTYDIGSFKQNLTVCTQSSADNLTIFTGSYPVQEGDFSINTPIIGYYDSASQIAQKNVSIDGIPDILSIFHDGSNRLLKQDDTLHVTMILRTNLFNTNKIWFNIQGVASNIHFSSSGTDTIYHGAYRVKAEDYNPNSLITGFVYTKLKTASLPVQIEGREVSISSCDFLGKAKTVFLPGNRIFVTLKGTPHALGSFAINGLSSELPLAESVQNSNLSYYSGSYPVKSADKITNGRVMGFLRKNITTVTQFGIKPVTVDSSLKYGKNKNETVVVQSLTDPFTDLELDPETLTEDSFARIVKADDIHDGIGYRFDIYKIEDQSEISTFTKPPLITIHYTKDELLAKNIDTKNNDRDNLRIFYYDLVQWTKIGGTVLESGETVSARVNHFSLYSIKMNTDDQKIAVRPNPFSPGLQDGINDLVEIFITNPEMEKVRIRIFDIRGRLVRELKDENMIQNNEMSIASWDGKNSENKLASEGVYILQIEKGSRRTQKTCVLAR